MNRTDAQAAITGHLRTSTRRTRRDGTTATLLFEVLDMYAGTVVADHDDKIMLLRRAAADAIAEKDELARKLKALDASVRREQEIASALAAGRDQARAECEELNRQVDELTAGAHLQARALRDAEAERDRLREQLAKDTDARLAEQDAMHADLGRLLVVTGLGDHARPQPPHEVMLEAIAEVRKIIAERDRLREHADSLAHDLDDCAGELSAEREAVKARTAERDRLREQLVGVEQFGNLSDLIEDNNRLREQLAAMEVNAKARVAPAPAADVAAPEATRAPQPRAKAAEGSSKGTGRKTPQKPAQRDGGTETEGFSG